jgi:hypothetical protein
MQVSTKTTVYLDGTEIRELVAQHLRDKGVLPEEAKFTVRVRSVTPTENTEVVLKEPKDCRVQVEWPSASEGPKVVGRVG